MRESPDTLNRVFVYGTLKRGQGNHVLIASYSQRIEPATTAGALYDLGEFPGLVAEEGEVQGEIVWIDVSQITSILSVLDRLEHCVPGHPEESYYHRSIVPVRLANGQHVNAYAYFYNDAHSDLVPVSQLQRVESGMWAGPQQTVAFTGSLDDYREYVRGFAGSECSTEA